ncbi:MAG: pilus assembly protein [Lachnospiraceae bacterium]|nr:pilus assembly protein [Lachnospiraceae bacterium]
MRKAGYTVEAAFIMPILLGILFLLMYVMFFVHDSAVLQGNFSYALCRTAEEEKAQENVQKRLSKGLWSAEITKVQFRRSFGKVSGEVQGRMKLKIPVMSYFIKDVQKIRCTGEYYYLQPEQYKKGSDS